MEQKIYLDENGNEYVLDEVGNKIPPIKTQKKYTTSGFTFYDDSQGHCCFCGRLTCKGNCFK